MNPRSVAVFCALLGIVPTLTYAVAESPWAWAAALNVLLIAASLFLMLTPAPSPR